MATILHRFFKRRPDLSGVKLTFLTKEDCHLCDEALAEVRNLQRRYRFSLEVVRIEPGHELFDRYWDKVPVGLSGGRMVFKFRFDPEELVRKLQAGTPSVAEA